MDGNNPNVNTDANNAGTNGANGGNVNQPGSNQAIDYDKIQQMLDGVLNAKENTALKAYFKQLGVSQEEMEQHITDFKAKQKEKAPNVDGLNATITAKDDEIKNLKAEIANMRLNQATSDLADELGFDAKHTKYVIKNAELKDVVKEDGTIDAEKLKTAIKNFLDDVPNFKKSATANNRSFNFDVGAKKPENNNSGNSGANNRPKNSRDLLGDIMKS